MLTAALYLLCASPALAEAGRFMLVRRDRPMESVLLMAATERDVQTRDSADQAASTPLDDCVALIDPLAKIESTQRGLLRLSDGQELPGEAVSDAPATARELIWNHRTLGRVQIALDRIESVTFIAGSSAPAPGDKDVVLLTNGDRLEGIIESLGDPLALDVTTDGVTTRVELQRDRVASVRLVTPHAQPRGRRVWLIDGSVLDVRHVLVGDDRLVRLVEPSIDQVARTERVQLFNIAAVLFEPSGLTPLGSLTPSLVDGPKTRYVIPEPRVRASAMPLGLSDVEYRGPLTVRYALPSSPMRFIAEARIPSQARSWGDCALVVLDDDTEVFRAALNADSPGASINAMLRGSQLTIKLEEGGNGPIQDTVILSRAMLLAEKPAR